MKLAKKSKWNWKKRYFVLQPNHIAYYENDKPNQKIRGEIRVTAESKVVADTYEKKYGYHFIFTNPWESLTLSTATEADRSQWILTINSVIQHAEESLMTHALLLYPAAKPSKDGKAAGKIADLTTRKYFILSKNLLTYYADEQKTSEIEGLININPHTVLDEINDDQRIISLIDSDADRTQVTFQFKAMNTAYESTSAQFQRWKTAIMGMVKPRGSFNAPTVEATPPAANMAPLKSALHKVSKVADSLKPLQIQTEDIDEAQGDVRDSESRPPLPLESPPMSPVPVPPPPPPDSPATPSTGRSTSRKVGFALLDDVDDTHSEPRAGRSKLPSLADEDAQTGSSDSHKQEPAMLGNALKQYVERRKSRSLSPAATPRMSISPAVGSPAQGRLSRTRSISASAAPAQRKSLFSPPDLGLFRASSSLTFDGAMGKLPTVEIFRSAGRQTLTKMLFDNFCRDEEALNINAIQELCYEVGVYFSLMEVKIKMKAHVNGLSTMNFVAFEKFWKANTCFRYVSHAASLR
jgi:hypothetical protein